MFSNQNLIAKSCAFLIRNPDLFINIDYLCLSMNFKITTMRKFTLCFFFIISFIATTTNAQPDFQISWALTDSYAAKPTWFGTDTERGLAYGNDHVYIVSRANDGLFVKILSASIGDYVGELNVDAGVINEGTYPLNDIEVDDGGTILACNLSVPSFGGGVFKIYKWNNESSSPELFLSYADDQLRLGDHFTVTGDISNDAFVYVAASQSNKVLRWEITEGTLNTAPTVIECEGIINMGLQASVWPLKNTADSEFFLTANEIKPKRFASDGTLVSEFPGESDDLFVGYKSAMVHFTIDTKEYIAMYNQRLGDESPGERLIIIDATNGLSALTVDDITELESIGSTDNMNVTGDVDIQITDSKIRLYFLATNNGVAMFESDIPDFSGIANPHKESIKIFPNPVRNAIGVYNLHNIRRISISNMLGQEIKRIDNLHSRNTEINVSDLLDGIYLVTFFTDKKIITTKKIIKY